MAYQRVTLSQIRTQLYTQLGSKQRSTTGYPTWTNFAGTVTQSGGIIYKLTGANAWDSGAQSVEYRAAGSAARLKWVLPASAGALIGLSADNPAGVRDSVDYAIAYFVSGAASSQIWENGVSHGITYTFNTNDVIEIEVSAEGVVRYLQNSTVLYTSTIPALGPLYATVALNAVNGVVAVNWSEVNPGTVGPFWSSAEVDRVINEVISMWQALTGDRVITITQAVTNTTVNIFDINTTHTNGTLLSVTRISPTGGGDSYREMSIKELDKGFYGWKSETASTTTQRPDYWSPIGIAKFALYPRVGATTTLDIQGYADSRPLLLDTDYIDIEEIHLQKLIGMMQAILSFKQGPVDGTDNIAALRTLFLAAADAKNSYLQGTALYRKYMGHDDSKGEPGPTPSGTGIRS